MTELNVTEAGTVQFPMVRHAVEIGWTPLRPQEALAWRGDEAGLLFRAEIEEALGRFNPWMTADAIRATVEKLEAMPPTIEGNREMLAWLHGELQGIPRRCEPRSLRQVQTCARQASAPRMDRAGLYRECRRSGRSGSRVSGLRHCSRVAASARTQPR